MNRAPITVQGSATRKRCQRRDSTPEVVELSPAYVQTELMGAQPAADPRAMPLTAFIVESMQLLTATPTPPKSSSAR